MSDRTWAIIFSDELRAAVDNCGMSRYRLAKLLGVSEAAMSKFMSGGGLSFDTLDKLAALLGLHVATAKRRKDK